MLREPGEYGPKVPRTGPKFISLLAHAPQFCRSLNIEGEQKARTQPKPWGPRPRSIMALLHGSQLVNAFELVALLPVGLVLCAAQMGRE